VRAADYNRSGRKDDSGMRLVGVGTDIVECSRIGTMIERHGEHFLQRVYTAREIAYCHAHKAFIERFAGRWAAKEAILKALGTGWQRGISWRDVEVRNEPDGRPVVRLGGAASARARQLQIADILVSISHCRSFAVAYALAVGVEVPATGRAG
jgi:holo-[acyl-carrier protein] synthase